jgi:1-deoxy-D-xylulose-5-phosphate reductoisomerase
LADGSAGLLAAVSRDDVDQVVVATSGIVSLQPTLTALRAGKTVAVANKEVLVTAGHLVTAAARDHPSQIRPVDSEHSAIWQCLRGEACSPSHDTVRRIILTASGGPFRDWPLERLGEVTVAEALRHPNWAMGPKITIDSATLMNKGLEALEAAWLFQQPLSSIEIVVHRESIIHSLVEFSDRSMKAQLGTPDMRLPIQYALAYPDRLTTPAQSVDLLSIGRLTFEPIDYQRFPCPGLAYEAGRLGQSYPTVLNAANEEAVRLFLADELGFTEIAPAIERTLAAHVPVSYPEVGHILEIDTWSRWRLRNSVLQRQSSVMI